MLKNLAVEIFIGHFRIPGYTTKKRELDHKKGNLFKTLGESLRDSVTKYVKWHRYR